MAAGLVAAVDDGLRNRIDPGAPLPTNSYLTDRADRGTLPMNLGEALAELDRDPVVRSALPGDMYNVFTAYKRDEWERFLATTTSWDFDVYLDYVP
jgi:glutamine synthetase